MYNFFSKLLMEQLVFNFCDESGRNNRQTKWSNSWVQICQFTLETWRKEMIDDLLGDQK